MNLPNKITVARFGLTGLLFAYLIANDTCSGPEWWAPAVAAGFFIVVVATDALDGYYARKLELVSDFGRIADPVADKVVMAGVFIFLASADWATRFFPPWMVVIIVSREFVVTGLRGFIETRGVAFPARWDGKLKMILQCVAVPAVFLVHMVELGSVSGWDWTHLPLLLEVFTWIALIMIWAGLVMTVTSGVRYTLAAAAVLRERPGASAGT